MTVPAGLTCRCDQPLATDDDGESSCFRCGRQLATRRPADEQTIDTLYLCRAAYPKEADARKEARQRVPRRPIVSLAKRKVRGGRVVKPQGRPSTNGDLGRPIWQVEFAPRAAVDQRAERPLEAVAGAFL